MTCIFRRGDVVCTDTKYINDARSDGAFQGGVKVYRHPSAYRDHMLFAFTPNPPSDGFDGYIDLLAGYVVGELYTPGYTPLTSRQKLKQLGEVGVVAVPTTMVITKDYTTIFDLECAGTVLKTHHLRADLLSVIGSGLDVLTGIGPSSDIEYICKLVARNDNLSGFDFYSVDISGLKSFKTVESDE